MGRFCEAQQYYKLAAMDEKNTEDAEINLGYSYGNMHAFWTEEEPWIVRKAQQLMNKHSAEFEKKAPELMNVVCGWPAPSFDVPKVDFTKIKDGDYEYWVNKNYLRINRFLRCGTIVTDVSSG